MLVNSFQIWPKYQLTTQHKQKDLFVEIKSVFYKMGVNGQHNAIDRHSNIQTSSKKVHNLNTSLI